MRSLYLLTPLVIPIIAMACGLSVQGASDTTTDAGANPTGTSSSGGGGADGSTAGADGGATVIDPPADDGGIIADARADGSGGPGGNCTLVFEDSFANQNANWDRFGSAQFQTGEVSLTQKNAGMQAGAIWWKTQITFTGFLRVAIDIAIDAVGVTPADGIAIGWVSTPYALGAANQNFGICNSSMNGFAVAADTLDAKLLLIASVNASCGTNNGVFPANAVGASNILAEFHADGLTGKFDTSAVHSRTLTLPKTGFLGFTASTGNGTAEHSISAVRVSNCQ